jgi:hypothetical protein
MTDEKCSNVINRAWADGGVVDNPVHNVRVKLEQCQSHLTCWSFRKFGNAEMQLKKKTKQLKTIQRIEDPYNWAEIKKLQDEIDFILE